MKSALTVLVLGLAAASMVVRAKVVHLTQADRNLFMKKINGYRRTEGLQPVTWSSNQAQRAAGADPNKCRGTYKQSTLVKFCSQEIPKTDLIGDAVKSDYADKSWCRATDWTTNCWNYRKMMCDLTTKVGCAIIKCVPKSPGQHRYGIVCDYNWV